MKHFIITLIALLGIVLPVSAQSQKQESFLFPDFVRGHLVFANGSTADVELDFDTIRQKLYYIRGNDVMELTNLQDVRSLTVGERSFVMRDGLLCEVYDVNGEKVLVNWKFRNVNKGSKGALGSTTQNHVDVLWTSGSHATADDRTGEHSLDIWQIRCENTYFLLVDGQYYRVKKLKELYKAFPAVAPQLKAFAKENHLLMTSAEDSFKIFTELFRLLGE
jgi:hypothetical protein